MFEKVLQPAMEGRARNSGFGFPGYGGCFPKATRSSRARGDHGTRKTSEATSDLRKDMSVFELLATVAGQLLQEQDDESLIARPLIELEASKPNFDGSNLDRSTACEGASCHTKSGKMDADEPGSLDLHKSEVLNEPSALSCLDNLDPSVLEEHNSKQMSQPIKAYFSRKRENSRAMGREVKTEVNGSRSEECMAQIKTDNSTNMNKLFQLNSREYSNMEGIDSIGEQDHHPLTDTRQCQGLDLLMGGPFQLDADSPPLVSSGSSEEITPHMEVKSYSNIAFNQSSRHATGEKEGFSWWKAREDDGHSSESIAPQTFPTNLSGASNMRAVKARRSASGLSKKIRATGVGSKQKRHDLEGEVKGDAVNCIGKRRKVKKMPSLKDGVEQLNPTAVGTFNDGDGELKKNISPTMLEREKVFAPASAASSTPDVMESNVKLSIKSFMVPELMVDLPESATIANLKKAVMDAAMSLLGGGLCVRVLLQGKRVTNEMESLIQAGISCSGDMDSLGFMLEPNPIPAVAASAKDTFMVHSSASRGAVSPTSLCFPKESEVTTRASFPAGGSERMHEIDENCLGAKMQSTTVSLSNGDACTEDLNGMVVPGSCAIILHPSQGTATMGSNSSAVVPFGQGPGTVGVNKRRIRRPFSVAEVEVLVQAVEKLGTGRWRDVKLHAFPQSKHRTYVDLKDKWKTLVHTASIAPHQRRGEPVPQGLLDRVIQAHAYWTAQQAKHQSMELNLIC